MLPGHSSGLLLDSVTISRGTQVPRETKRLLSVWDYRVLYYFIVSAVYRTEKKKIHRHNGLSGVWYRLCILPSLRPLAFPVFL